MSHLLFFIISFDVIQGPCTMSKTVTTTIIATARSSRKRRLFIGQSFMLLCIQMGIWVRMGWWTAESSFWRFAQQQRHDHDDDVAVVVGPPPSFQQQHQQQQVTTTTNNNNNTSRFSISPASTTTTVNNDDKNDKRPYFILHIGPPKSGTTTLQEELSAHNDDLLRLDNFLYTGQYYKNTKKSKNLTQEQATTAASSSSMPFIKRILSTQCHLQLEKRRLKFQKQQQRQNVNNNQSITTAVSSSAFASVLRQVECWKDALTVLESFRLNKTNIIHSDETYGYKNWRYWDNSASNSNNSTSTTSSRTKLFSPWDWISLHATLQDAGWNVVVVIGYRHYTEWIISVKQHVEKWTGRKPRHAQWPIITQSLQQHQQHQQHSNNMGGIVFESPFPNILTVQLGQQDNDDMLKSFYPFYDINFILESLLLQQHIIAGGVPMMDVRILNLHQETTVQQTTSSVRTTFFCQVLNAAAPNACRESRAMDIRHELAVAATTTTTRHQGQQNHNDTITTTQLHRRANVAAHDAVQSVMYDVLTTTAAAMGMINTKNKRHTRRSVVEACRQFHETVLHNKILPFTCPTTEQLQALLDLSLQKEVDVFQKVQQFAAASTTTTTTRQQQHSPPLLLSTQQHHVDSFWKAALLPNHTNKYCWIDAPAVLQTKEWQGFFATFQ